jgi:hypothetical protein
MLTKPTTDGYPATEVIKFLLEVVGRDVVSFRRNAQVSYILVDRARDICDAINTHIKKTETGTGTDLDWASFAKFSDAIDPAEDALFQLSAYTEDERTRHLFKGDTVQDCIISADHWVTNRDGIWNALNLLETSTELSNLFDIDALSRQAEREEARTHDDKTFFEEVIIEIDRAFTSLPHLKVPPIVLKMLENLRDLLDKISTRAISPTLTDFTLKTGLLVQGVTKLAFHTEGLDNNTVNNLRSGNVWATAAQLVELLNSTRDDGARSMEKVRRKYDDFLKLLHNAKDLNIPKAYIDLLKLAGKVRRPFHSQAVALVSLCRTLVTEWQLEKNHTPENLALLEGALNATLKGLEEAVATATELKIYNLDDLEYHPAYQTLEKARAPIKTCHDRLFELPKWNQWEVFISDAIQKDKDRMSQLNKILEKRPSPTTQNQIELTVYVFEPTSLGNVYQTTFPVEGSTRLSAVRWTVAGALDESLRKRARQRGEFVLPPNDTPCDLHEALSQFAGSNRRCTLRLII